MVMCYFSVLLLQNSSVAAESALTNSEYLSATGLETVENPSLVLTESLKNIDLKFLTSEPQKASITCFDVNENGMFALALKGSSSDYISVYNPDGSFAYGYSFDLGGGFDVELGDNGIVAFINEGKGLLDFIGR